MPCSLASLIAARLRGGAAHRTNATIEVGAYRLSLSGVSSNEEAVARVEEHLRGRCASGRAEAGPLRRDDVHGVV
jgi:hypothetical protein